MSADNPGAERKHKEASSELQRFARQASAAAGSFLRWSVYLETDPDSAIAKMRTVLITPPSTGNPSPFLSLIAATVLSKIDPASIETCRQRREQMDRERAEWAEASRAYWEQEESKRQQRSDKIVGKLQAAAAKTGVAGQDGNVVKVDFIGAS
ncbi:MAG: hypothetical protein O6909_03710 [Alphaproteobacteria bacterium]|nr:hypothetical protein [Alphaproteobacteria bacterium]